MSMESIGPRGSITPVYRLNGRFGAEEARDVCQMISSAAEGTRLVLDFTRVGEFQDLAIGALADTLQHSVAAVAVRGLAVRQRRLLRYLGFDPDAAAHSAPAPAHG